MIHPMKTRGANGNVLKDSAINASGAEVVITRKDGRGFYFESLAAAGVAVISGAAPRSGATAVSAARAANGTMSAISAINAAT